MERALEAPVGDTDGDIAWICGLMIYRRVYKCGHTAEQQHEGKDLGNTKPLRW
jgi:hypothetical protein